MLLFEALKSRSSVCFTVLEAAVTDRYFLSLQLSQALPAAVTKHLTFNQ